MLKITVIGNLANTIKLKNHEVTAFPMQFCALPATASTRIRIRKAMNGDDRGFDELALKNRLNELDKMFDSLLKLTAKSADSTEYFDEKFKEITDEQDAIKRQLKEQERSDIAASNANARLNYAFEQLPKTSANAAEYDDMLCASVVERVTVMDGETVRIRLSGGFEIEAKV